VADLIPIASGCNSAAVAMLVADRREQRGQRLARRWGPAASEPPDEITDFGEIADLRQRGELRRFSLEAPPLRRRRLVVKRPKRRFGAAVLGGEVLVEIAAEHLFQLGKPGRRVLRHRPSSGYDVIYHVGVIGCVADPIGLTTELLRMLRPGGKLLFNAPNRGGLHLNGQLWLDSAPPPDLVTLFPETFWKRRFSDVANVVERAEMLSSDTIKQAYLGV